MNGEKIHMSVYNKRVKIKMNKKHLKHICKYFSGKCERVQSASLYNSN